MIPKLRFKEFRGEWSLSSIKDALHDAKLGGNIDNNPSGTGTALIKMGNLGRGTIQMDKIFYATSLNENLDEYLLKTGDLLFNTRNTLELVGKVSIWRGEIEHALYNSNILRLKFKNNWFWNHLLNTPRSLNKLRRIATGTTSVAAIYSRDLYKLKFYECQYSEQQKIANFLELVNDKINLLTKKKEALETYKKGLMQKIFSQELRFKREDGTDYPEWEAKHLGDISSISIGEFVIKTKQSDDGQYPVYNGGQTPTGYYDEYNNEGNKIVISARGASAGFVNFQNERYWAGNSCYSVSLTKPTYNIRFFYHYLKAYQRRFTDYQQAANIPSVSKKDVQLFQVKVPCDKEQNRIAEFFDLLDISIENVERQLIAIHKQKKGLLQQMFV